MQVHFTAVYAGSVGFIVTGGALAASRRFRERFLEIFRLPPPVNQAVIKPFDSLRGLAALWVALYHSWQWHRPANDPGTKFLIEQGYLAVPVFVTMSAFLIYRTLKPVASAAQLGGYLKRRWLRIYPLYFVTTAAVLLFGFAATRVGPARAAAEFLMLRVLGYRGYFNPPAWSLYVEEGFYLLVPLWFLLCRRRVALSALASYAVFSVLCTRYPSRELDLIKYFCIGILLTEAIDRADAVRVQFRWAVLAIGLLLGFITVSSHIPARPYYWFYFPEAVTQHFFALAVFCVLWAAVNIAPVSAFLSQYPLRFLGIISYSVYMWHPILLASGTPIVFTGTGSIAPESLAAAGIGGVVHGPLTFFLFYGTALVFYSAVSYALIEYPFLLMRRRTVQSRAV